MRWCLFIFLLIALQVSACRNPSKNHASSAKPSTIGNCLYTGVGFCLQYKSLAAGVSKDELKKGCIEGEGVWADGVCPAANKFAVCDFSHDVGTGSTYFYSPYEPADAKDMCSSKKGTYRSIP
jgi:hypothetical protein